jgi:hypothetical protein
MKVVELTQTRPTPFQGNVQRPPGGIGFKRKHLELNNPIMPYFLTKLAVPI